MELLVVVAIIVILLALLLPSARQMRIKALRLADLSNLSQFTTAAITAGNDGGGAFPVGQREGSFNNSSADDMVWFNWKTWDKLEKSYGVPREAGSCITYQDTDHFKKTLFKRYRNGTRIGWIYWGGRKTTRNDQAGGTRIRRPIVDKNGNNSAELYELPSRFSTTPSTRTLATCKAYTSPHSWGGWLPHGISNEKGEHVDRNFGPFDFELSAGMNMSFTDGAARWVPWGDLGAMRDDGVDWLYFDKTSGYKGDL